MSYAPMAAEHDSLETSEDAVLDGRLRLRQPLSGHRVGHDAILLAAATGGRAGELAVDLGAGVGGAGLALAVRVEGLKVVLVEIDAALAHLAAENARANGLGDRVRVIAADVDDVDALAAAGLAAGIVDHVLMNPPFHDAGRHNVSPDAGRRLAHAGGLGLLQHWVTCADRLLKARGVLTLIWRADELNGVLAALAVGFGAVAIRPVLPRDGAAPIRVLVGAAKGGSGDPTFAPALILNDVQGRPSAAAEAVLRGGQTLTLGED
jgi:tRNA1(Val) A37 N6-methylase TrmN6